MAKSGTEEATTGAKKVSFRIKSDVEIRICLDRTKKYPPEEDLKFQKVVLGIPFGEKYGKIEEAESGSEPSRTSCCLCKPIYLPEELLRQLAGGKERIHIWVQIEESRSQDGDWEGTKTHHRQPPRCGDKTHAVVSDQLSVTITQMERSGPDGDERREIEARMREQLESALVSEEMVSS